MIFGIDRNRTNLTLAVILMSAMAISCTIVREFGNRTPEKTRKFNEGIPAGIENAERDHRIDDPSIFKIILPGSGQILLRDPESSPIDLSTLGQNVREFAATKSPDLKVVYLAGSIDIPSNEVSDVLDELRNQGIDKVNLLTSSRKSSDDDGWFGTEIRGPDRVLEVRIRTKIIGIGDRPNPLTLLISMSPDGKPLLNNEPHLDLLALAARLREIFKLRESNGVFRENTNEVEKTVTIKLDGQGTNWKYGEIVKLIDAIKGGGSNPIVLGDAGTIWEPPDKIIPRIRPTPSDRQTPKDPPKIISGGVLNGKATSLPKPPYPAAARAVNASGMVSVQVTIGEDGKIIAANAVSGHPLLRPAAVAAARSAQFSPTLLSGRPVKVTGVLTYNFVPEPR